MLICWQNGTMMMTQKEGECIQRARQSKCKAVDIKLTMGDVKCVYVCGEQK